MFHLFGSLLAVGILEHQLMVKSDGGASALTNALIAEVKDLLVLG